MFSDNNPLTYVLSSAKLNATGCRWVAELADFHFTIRYRPGKENVDADSLSRMPTDVETVMRECTEELSSECVGATIQAVETQNDPDPPLTLVCQSTPTSLEMGDEPYKSLSKQEIQENRRNRRFVQVYATTSKSGKTVAYRLFNDFALRFGFPSRIHHDQGKEFENQLFDQLQKYSDITASRTTPYHPQGNGQVERFNRTILQILKTLTEKQKLNWKETLNKLVFAYNCTKSEVTGFSPFYLLFGRSLRLPVDALFGLNPDNNSISQSEYVERWTKGMQEAYEIAREHVKKNTERNKRHYDQKVRCTNLHPGSRVLVKNMTPRGGPGKLRNYWEDEVHIVIGQAAEDTPIYEVKPEQGKGRARVLHRNHLLPCDHLPLVTTQTQNTTPKRKLNKNTQLHLPREGRNMS